MVETATVGVKYSAQVAFSGGLAPYNWTSGANLNQLGLALDPASGVISGTPTVSGAYHGGISVTDGEATPATVTATISIPINAPPPGLTTTTISTSNANIAVGQQVTFTAKVNSSLTATGLITFAAGSTTLRTATLNTSNVGTLNATFNKAGAYNVIASYAGDTYNEASVSQPLVETVVAPSVTATVNPVGITIKPGASGTLTITVTPTGGYTGTVSFSCGMLPTDVSCTFVPPSITLAAGSGPVTNTPTINTAATHSAMLSSPLGRERPGQAYPAMMFWLPGSLAALVGVFPRKRKRPFARRLWMLALILLALGGVGTVSGCGGLSNDARPGTYAIPVTLTLTGGAAQTVNANVIIQ